MTERARRPEESAQGDAAIPTLPTRILVALVVALAAPLPARAHFVLYLQGEAGSYVESGIKRFSDADGDLTGYGTAATGVSLSFMSADFPSGDWFYLDFRAPAGSDLVPGTYLGATRAAFAEPGTPGLDVGGNGQGCNTLTGSFVVHEIAFGPANAITALSVDFEQHCDGQPPALRGSVRWNAGDAACDSPSAVGCDDGDACTTGDQCDAGSCMGGFIAPASCGTPAEQCVRNSACSPVLGECPPGTPAQGTPCDDGNPCTSYDACQDGSCVGVETRSCDDGNPCTLDACGPSDCSHTAVEGCWPLVGTARVTACAQGRCAHRSTPLTTVIVIAPNGTFAKPNGTCPTTGAVLSDEVGTWTERRDGRIVLATTNLRDMLSELAACPDVDRDLIQVLRKGRRSYRQTYEILRPGERAFCGWARELPADGAHICGQQKVHATITFRGVAVAVSIRWRFTGPITF